MPEILPELLLKFRTEVIGSEKIEVVKGSIKEASNSILHFKKTLDVTSASSAENVKKLQDLQNHYLKLNQTVKAANTPFDQLLKSNQQMSNAVLNMNYVIRDSPYFMRNFGMGIMAIGNNLNPLIDSMIRANLSAKELGMTFTQALTKSLVGAGGVMFAMSLAVAAFQAIVFAMEGSKRKVKELTESFGDQEKQLYKTIESLERYKAALPGYEEGEKALDIAKKLLRTKKDELKVEKDRLEELRKVPERGLGGEIGTRREQLITLQIQKINVLTEEVRKLKDQEKGIILTMIERNKVTELGNEILKGSVVITKDFTDKKELTINQIKALINYIEEETGQFKKNSEQVKIVNQSLDILRDRKEKTNKLLKEEKSLLEQMIGTTYEDYIEKLGDINSLLSKLEPGTYNFNRALEEQGKIIKELGWERILDIGQAWRQMISEIDVMQSQLATGGKDMLYARRYRTDEKFRAEVDRAKKDAERAILATQKEQLQIQKDQVQAALQLVSVMGQLGGKTDSFLSQLANVLRTIIMIKSIMDLMKLGEEKGGIDKTTGYLGILASILSMIGGFHTGGIVKAHGGMLARNEVPIIAQRGEMILTQSQQANMFNQLKYGGGSSQKIYLNVDSKTIMEFVVKPRLLRTLGELQRTRSN